jgi:iron-sulfur cluster assembly protein
MSEPLLTLDRAAWDAIWDEADEQGWHTFKECYLRVGVRGGGCSGFSYDMDLMRGDPTARDIVWTQDEQHTPPAPMRIAVDPISAQYLKGTVIQYVQSGLQKGFVFKNPMAKRTCGCGKSFSA